MYHSGPIAGIAAHGPWVATAGYDNRLILWDAETREPLARVMHDHLVNACDFSHDGQFLVSASSDYSARIWALPNLRLMAVLTGHGDDVDMARFSPDDSLVATCALDRVVRVFGADGVLRHEMTGHTGNILALAWIDNRRFVTSSVDGTLRTWNADGGTCLGVDDLGMRSDCVEILPDGRIIAGDDLGRIAVLAGGTATFVPAHEAGIKKLVIARVGLRMVTLGYDGTLAVWDLAGPLPRPLARSPLPPQIWARAATVCPDGRIAAGTFGTTYAVFTPACAQWDMAGVAAGPAINAVIEHAGACTTIGDAGQLRTDCAPVGAVGSLCNFLCATDERLLTGGHLGEIYDAHSGAVLYRHHSPLNCAVAFDTGGKRQVAVGAYTGEILIFDTGPDLVLARVNHPYVHAVKSLAAAQGMLFSVCANTDVAWHDPATGAEIRRVRRAHTRIANAACALAGEGFASVGRDRMLRLWLNDHEEAYPTPHPNSVKCIAASPCGRWIASGSYGGTVAIFDRATRSFAPMRQISKAGIAALCWGKAAGAFLAASYAGEVVPDRPAPACRAKGSGLMHVILLCGSARGASYSGRLLDLATAQLPPGTTISRLGPADVTLPLVNPDCETTPAVLAELRTLNARFATADAVILACPEYNAGIPPFVKNTIDWISRLPWIDDGAINVFADLPVLILAVSGATGGALIPALRAVLGYVGAISFGRELCAAVRRRAVDTTRPFDRARIVRAVGKIARSILHLDQHEAGRMTSEQPLGQQCIDQPLRWHEPRLDAGHCASGTMTDRERLSLPPGLVITDLQARVSDAMAALRSAPVPRLLATIRAARQPLARRIAAGNLLALCGDPRIDPMAPAMIDIAAGEVEIGLETKAIEGCVQALAHLGIAYEWIAKEAPRHRVHLPPYRIARYPVTNLEYRDFLLEGGHEDLPSSWAMRRYPTERANHPVHSVSPAAAEAYTRWLSVRTGRRFRLPSEAEWETAAAGPMGREYPWGAAFDPALANTGECGLFETSPVGAFVGGEASCGAADMAGNVEEFTADIYEAYPGGSFVADHLVQIQGAYRVARGGCFSRFGDLARTRRRHGHNPRSAVYAMGFRLAETP